MKPSATPATSEMRPSTNGTTVRHSSTFTWTRRLSVDEPTYPHEADAANASHRPTSANRNPPTKSEIQVVQSPIRRQLANEVDRADVRSLASDAHLDSRRKVVNPNMKVSLSIGSQPMSLGDGEYTPSPSYSPSSGLLSNGKEILPISSVKMTSQMTLDRTPGSPFLESLADERAPLSLLKLHRLRDNTSSPMISESGSSTSSQKRVKRCRICTGTGELFPLLRCVSCHVRCHGEWCGVVEAAVMRDGLQVKIGGLRCNICRAQNETCNVQERRS